MSQERVQHTRREVGRSLKSLRKSREFIDRWTAARQALRNGAREIIVDYATRSLQWDEAFCFRCGHRFALQDLQSVREIERAEEMLPLDGFFCQSCDWLWCRACVTRKDNLGRPLLLNACPKCASNLEPATGRHSRALASLYGI